MTEFSELSGKNFWAPKICNNAKNEQHVILTFWEIFFAEMNRHEPFRRIVPSEEPLRDVDRKRTRRRRNRHGRNKPATPRQCPAVGKSCPDLSHPPENYVGNFTE